MTKSPADQQAVAAAVQPPPARAEDIAAARVLFEREVASIVRERLPLTVALFLAMVGLSVLLELYYHPERTATVLLFYALEAVACLVALLANRLPRTREWPVLITALLSAVLATLLTVYASLVATPLELLGASLVCLLSGLFVLVPWGWRAQLTVALAALASLGSVASYTPSAEAWNYSILAVLTAAITSVCGAFYLDRYRFEAYLRTALLIHASAANTAIIEGSFDAFVAMDQGGRVVEFNPAAERMFGYARADAVGRELSTLVIPPLQRERHHRGLQRYLQTGQSEVLGRRREIQALRADGSEFPVELSVARVARDGPPLFVGYMRDLTERRRAEEQQAASYRLLYVIRQAQRLFLEDTPVTELFQDVLRLVVAATHGELGFVVAAVRRGDGVTSFEQLAVTRLQWNDASHESYRCVREGLEPLHLEALYDRVVTTGQPVVQNDLAAAVGGGNFPGRFRVQSFLGLPLYHAEGELVGVIGLANRPGGYDDAIVEYLRPLQATCAAIVKACRNAQERRAAEDALEASKRQSEEEAEISATLLNVGHVLSASIGQPNLIERVTQLAIEALQCDASGVGLWDEAQQVFRIHGGMGLSRAAHAEILDMRFTAENLPLLGALRPGSVLEIHVDQPQEQFPVWLLERWGLASMLVVPVARGDDVVGALCVAYCEASRPFTRRQRRLGIGIAQALSLALETAGLIVNLRDANRVKTEFVSTMSHELRTPLNVILGFCAMAQDDGLGEQERAHCLKRIDGSARELLSLIEDTLEIAKMEGGRDDIELETVALADFWAELGEVCGRIPRKPGVALNWGRRVPAATLLTDPRKLSVIVRNLVGNACKFTENGWVRADAHLEDEALVLRIADTGIGIRAEDQQLIFEMFRQADGSDRRRYGGTGLGLYIVRRYVDRLNGSIELQSAPGSGSVFTVRVPTAPPAVAQATGTSAA